MRDRLQDRSAAWAAAALFGILVVPPLRQALESSMSSQMLVQFPLLVAVGLLAARTLPARFVGAVDGWNHRGIAGIVLLSVASAFWMVPRLIDASVTDPRITLAKYLSLPLLVGLPLALSWPRMGFVVKGVFLLEGIATFFRLGWLYLAWPDRLCTLYLQGDQQRLGKALLLIGTALFLATAWKLVWGRFESLAMTSPPAAHSPGYFRL